MIVPLALRQTNFLAVLPPIINPKALIHRGNKIFLALHPIQ